jgi:FMN reductase
VNRSIVVVTAGLSQPSSTRLLADRLAASATSRLRSAGEDVSVSVVEVRELAHDLTDHLLTGFPSPRLGDVLGRVGTADGLVVVTPVFSASYSGLFKTFFDVLEDDTLDGTPVLVAATGGTARHSLALDYAVRPLFTYLRASVVPTAVFAASEDFGSGGGGTSLSARIDRAAGELADLVLSRPTRPRTDPFAKPIDFADLLTSH